MLLTCDNITKAYGETTIIKNVSFLINEHDRIGIVGVNGAGKSTLFKILTNEINSDSGNVYLRKDLKVGYLDQNKDLNINNTIYNELLSLFNHLQKIQSEINEIEKQLQNNPNNTALINKYSNLTHEFEKQNGFIYLSNLKGVIKGLGLNENQLISELSGGERSKVSLAKLLLTNPDLLLLDEPTNHLDLKAITWLENYLKNGKKALLVISHDRYFLEQVTNKTLEIYQKKAKIYHGNYTYYLNQKVLDEQKELHDYTNQQRYIKKQEESIARLRSYDQEKFYKRAKSKEKMLAKIDVLEKPQHLKTDIKLEFDYNYHSAKLVLEVNNLKMGFENKSLFENINFEIRRQEKVALIGDNGIGKTTLLKIILENLNPLDGDFKLGEKVTTVYYDQQMQNLTDTKTVLQELHDAYPLMSLFEVRSFLAKFLFTGEDVFKRVSSLSGGEKGRLALAKIMLTNANFLILDEPTNHLDIFSKTVLENAINDYQGTVLYISHDRFFINQTATKIIELTKDKAIIVNGNYDDYLAKQIPIETNKNKTIDSRTSQKEKEAKIRKTKKEIEQLLALIEQNELIINQINQDINNTNDYNTINDLTNKRLDLENEVTKLIDSWEQLNHLLDTLGN